jgi:pimeloyl-ACP methyl ester carboxylesterase
MARPALFRLPLALDGRGMNAIDYDIRRLAQRADCLTWAAATRPGIRILDLPGSRVRVRVAGRGERTLVFACDMPNVVESYDELVRLLGDQYRIVCWEQPGFAFSYPKAGFGFGLEDYAAVMGAMLEALAFKSYVVVASCQNVYQALLVADRWPHLVESVVLMQAVRWQEMRPFAVWAMKQFAFAGAFIPAFGDRIVGTPWVGQWLWASMERRIARRTHPHVIYRAQERKARFEQITQPLYAAHEHGACACFASAFQHYYEYEAALPCVRQPALVLWASADRGHAQSDPKGLLEYAPHATWREIPETGHHLELENPEAVSTAIREFLR